ncbi:MAG: Receptor family ligand binding region [Methanoregulaceae archaeon PtaB.Bin009]|nr:MAG: Receptor family ligand binding region [Methanoregulaceae archaeon PtaB.Bin009]OPY42239.1 MAG: Receptor family ligand binding region [Methanoregulaceae archaeon PtaU1.Bin066]HNQ29651.1 ABC transporter substrate-binding protein [Methanolinea sp.]
MKKKYCTIVALLLILVLCAACTDQQPVSQETLKIGVVASMTGPASTTGKDIWQSAVLAADEINAKGGVFVKDLNRKIPITLIQGDDESTREGGQKAVSRMITQDKVDVLVGGFSSAVVSAHQSIVAEHGIPYIITGASTPTITQRTDIDTATMFHYCPTTDDYGEQTTLFVNDAIRDAVNARFKYPDNRPLRLALLVQDSPYGKGVQNAVHDTIERRGLNIVIVAEETFKMGETDFRTVLTTIKAAQPDVVYPAAFLNEQIPMVTQARRDVGLNTIFLAVECNDDPDYYEGLGKYGEYSIIETRFSPYAIPRGDIADDMAAFRENFQKRWGSYPGMMGASTYEGIYIAAQAVENAGTREKVKVRAALDALTMPQMIEAMQGGVITFTDDFREAKFDLYMEQLVWNETTKELRPVIVWPDHLKEADFVLPEWYVPGPGSSP